MKHLPGLKGSFPKRLFLPAPVDDEVVVGGRKVAKLSMPVFIAKRGCVAVVEIRPVFNASEATCSFSAAAAAV